MVLPLSDDSSDRDQPPVVNWALIAVNVLVFVGVQWLGANEGFTYSWSVVPEEIVTGGDVVTPDQEYTDPLTGKTYVRPGLGRTPVSVYLTLLTSMFMHGGIVHILGNMWFLFIFGDNVEDALGHVRYLVFYLVCGVLASLAHVGLTWLSGADMRVPCLGASGAISGVLGGYLVLFPRKRVTVLLFRVVTQVPAWVAIGTWFLFQLVSGVGALGEGTRQGGVAYAAHVGGFLAGMALVYPFGLGRDLSGARRPAPPEW